MKFYSVYLTGMSREVENLIKENNELLATKYDVVAVVQLC